MPTRSEAQEAIKCVNVLCDECGGKDGDHGDIGWCATGILAAVVRRALVSECDQPFDDIRIIEDPFDPEPEGKADDDNEFHDRNEGARD